MGWFFNNKQEESFQDDPPPQRAPSDSYSDEPMMGSIVRRRRVVTMPINNSTFFPGVMEGIPENDVISPTSRQRQKTKSKDSLFGQIVRRKQVSLDLMSPEAAAFFDIPEYKEAATDEVEVLPKMISPLRFSPRKKKHDADQPADVEKSANMHSPQIVRAGRKDKIKTLVLAIILIAFCGVCVGWKTHEEKKHSLFGIVGAACETPCSGDNFFIGHENHFSTGDVIQLTMHLDPLKEAGSDDRVIVEILRTDKDENGSKIQTVVYNSEDIIFGPPHEKERKTFKEKFSVDWANPDNKHSINAYSESGNPLTFTLAAQRQTSLSKNSVLVAALIMVAVYIFILIEVIHRTLVSIFGSMIALFFFFLMHRGETESIKVVMLHQEWSTLGLLFGMMVIVGELSHTGVFEWLAVRLLVQSKGSFNRLMVLLCLLTAVASAFLDNVTTMLLLAPVTIDMCGILNVDPRPFLISEVILSNIGGTATQIGDPPNIIIGASFDEVGFVDFIINIMPAIFIVAVPISLVLMLWIYKPYMTYKPMPALDEDKLKATYPIYDEPRLLIAGTSTFFLIVLFFLHPLHHKDTAWLALITAFITISFTNPHDVQDVLRNHVEWDTLLFFAGLFVLVEVCAGMGLLNAIGGVLANIIKAQDESQQLSIAITLILWVSAVTSAFLDNIPYTATMIPIVKILAAELPETLPIKTLAWALSFGACLGGNGTLLGASANIVTAGIATNKGYEISFMNFFYPGMLAMIVTTAIANLYMMVVYIWIG